MKDWIKLLLERHGNQHTGKILVNIIKPRPSTEIWMNGTHWKKSIS